MTPCGRRGRRGDRGRERAVRRVAGRVHGQARRGRPTAARERELGGRRPHREAAQTDGRGLDRQRLRPGRPVRRRSAHRPGRTHARRTGRPRRRPDARPDRRTAHARGHADQGRVARGRPHVNRRPACATRSPAPSRPPSPTASSRAGSGDLQRAEQWSGFGFSPSGQPCAHPRPRRARPHDAGSPPAGAAQAQRGREAPPGTRLGRARKAFDEADAAFDEARSTEQGLSQEIKRLTKKLAKLQDQLDAARSDIESARSEVTVTRSHRREARSALDRAERDAAD